jgi:hypothetical protein
VFNKHQSKRYAIGFPHTNRRRMHTNSAYGPHSFGIIVLRRPAMRYSGASGASPWRIGGLMRPARARCATNRSANKNPRGFAPAGILHCLNIQHISSA